MDHLIAQQIASRREFLKSAVLAGTAVPLAAGPLSAANKAKEKSPIEKVNLAVIGVDGRGGANLNGVANAGANIVALCDIDANRLAKQTSRFPNAKTFEDFRGVFDMDNLDGVVISTPDHMHAIPAAMALRKGLPVYCEKPLTHSVYEARTLRKLSIKAGVPTQMGNQIHSGTNYRRVVEIVQAGVIGPVKRVHVWLNKSYKTGVRAKEGQFQVPKGVNYDLWLGPAPYRPFHASHFHFNWRYWWDFGNGTLGDFGCHYIDLPFWALKLTAPTTVQASGKVTHDGDNRCPDVMQVEYEFPSREGLPPVHLTWYHGGLKPEGAEVYGKGSAVLFEGEYGKLLADYSTRKVFMQADQEQKPVKPSIPDSVGHHQEWVDAIKNGTPTTSTFDYGGNLTESVLLGNVSYRLGGKKIAWDADKLEVTNDPEALNLIRREYRNGWTL